MHTLTWHHYHNHRYQYKTINSLRKKTKSPTCVQAKLCANCLVKISPKPTDFSHLMMFIANLLQPKICTIVGAVAAAAAADDEHLASSANRGTQSGLGYTIVRDTN